MLVTELFEQMFDHETEARIGDQASRCDEREHRQAFFVRSQAIVDEEAFDDLSVELGERMVMHTAIGGRRAARTEDLARRRGGQLEGLESRHRHRRDLTPVRQFGGAQAACLGQAPDRLDALVLKCEDVEGQAIEIVRRGLIDETFEALQEI